MLQNVSFALLNERNVTKTSFDHASAGTEGSCLWALGLIQGKRVVAVILHSDCYAVQDTSARDASSKGRIIQRDETSEPFRSWTHRFGIQRS